jgi:ribosome-binding factor A
MSNRGEKLGVELAHLAATFIAREANRDVLITPIRAEVSPNGKQATIFLSIFPVAGEERALAFLNRRVTDFKSFARTQAKLRMIPHITFEIDIGEKNRQRIDEISNL